jgi:hypothetical protein
MTICVESCGNYVKLRRSCRGRQMCWDYAYKEKVSVSLKTDVGQKERDSMEKELLGLQLVTDTDMLPEVVPLVKKRIAELQEKLGY